LKWIVSSTLSQPLANEIEARDAAFSEIRDLRKSHNAVREKPSGVELELAKFQGDLRRCDMVTVGLKSSGILDGLDD
jgi:hypothetical protein